MHIFQLLLFCLCISCSSNDHKSPAAQLQEVKGEYIYRLHDEYLFIAEPPQKISFDPYPWEKGGIGNLPKITKEYFRCKGSNLNPVHIVQQNGEPLRCFDCGGTEKHSLPLRDDKEFIYSILIDLLNHLQSKTGKRVVITSGHRCPEHNAYVDASPSNQHSKHMIGAEVSFYVHTFEEKPEAIIKLLQDYYKNNPKYTGQKEFEEFQRYEKNDTDVTTSPWYNKEIFVKLFKKKEGRDFDNRHPYPYLSIQVRYDIATKEKVVFSWEKAHKNYLRK